MLFNEFSRKLNRFVRVSGHHEPAAQLFARVLAQGTLPVLERTNGSPPADDYLLVDPSLAVTIPEPTEGVAVPDPRLGYAGYTPQQRFELLEWLTDPTQPASSTFQQFYLTHLESCLFDGAFAEDALLALCQLQSVPAWQTSEKLARVTLLGHWLKQEGGSLVKWLGQGQVDANTLGVALGMAALLAAPLSPPLLSQMWMCWRPNHVVPPPQVLAQRLLSLTTTLGQDPLAYALAQLPNEARAPKPWRALHRDLRIALPQPDLRPVFEPLLDEVVTDVGHLEPENEATEDEATENAAVKANRTAAKAEQAKGTKRKRKAVDEEEQWLLVLEFGHSRSEYFDYVLHRVQAMPSFTQILDENRQLVYRVHFRKRDMRSFWRLWDYVQNWSNTHVYIDGKELEKWKIWPYSQYMR